MSAERDQTYEQTIVIEVAETKNLSVVDAASSLRCKPRAEVRNRLNHCAPTLDFVNSRIANIVFRINTPLVVIGVMILMSTHILVYKRLANVMDITYTRRNESEQHTNQYIRNLYNIFRRVKTKECGLIAPNEKELIIGGRSVAKHEKLPWHVGIYRLKTTPSMQICGGSIVSNRLVITAARCFWDDKTKLQPAFQYAVAAGKTYRPWNNPRDTYAQKSYVQEIKIPDHFRGNEANFQDDIALLILQIPFEYTPFVRPICLDFDPDFDEVQLQPGNKGKVAKWGLREENGNSYQALKAVELPYVDVRQCYRWSPLNFTEYITSDKICAFLNNGTALCPSDRGGGLAFPESRHGGVGRYYLRGIVSTAPTPNNEDKCTRNTLITFTHLLKHEHFVMKYLASDSGFHSREMQSIELTF